MRPALFLLPLVALACPRVPPDPAENLALDYTQAYLRRDVVEMKSLSANTTKQPTPNFMMSTMRAVRTCPPIDGKFDGTKVILVLIGPQEASSFQAFAVTVHNPEDQWLVIAADFLRDERGRLLQYSRTCKQTFVAGTTGGL